MLYAIFRCTHCNILLYAIMCCYTPLFAGIRYDTLRYSAVRCYLQYSLQDVATGCCMLLHAAICCPCTLACTGIRSYMSPVAMRWHALIYIYIYSTGSVYCFFLLNSQSGVVDTACLHCLSAGAASRSYPRRGVVDTACRHCLSAGAASRSYPKRGGS